MEASAAVAATTAANESVGNDGPRSRTVFLHLVVLQLAWFGGLIAAGLWLTA